MSCIAAAGASLPGYLIALGCVVMGQIFAHYTALALCMAAAGLILRKRFPGVQPDKKALTKATAIWSVMTLVLGLLLCIAFVAPYLLYNELVKETQSLSQRNRELQNVKKQDLVEQLIVFLSQGRRFEAEFQLPGGINDADKTRIQVWQEQVELIIAGSPYKGRLSLLKEEAGVPLSDPPASKQPGIFSIWKSVRVMNYRIKEFIQYIRDQDATNS